MTERALRFPPGERLHVPLLDPRGPGGEEFRDNGAMFPVIESNDAGCLFQVLSAQGCLCQAGETQADPLAAEGAFLRRARGSLQARGAARDRGTLQRMGRAA